MCYNDIIFGGALVSPEISKKVPKDPLFLKLILFVACSLVSYLSRVARINVTEQVLASESRHAARRRKNPLSFSDPPCNHLTFTANMRAVVFGFVDLSGRRGLCAKKPRRGTAIEKKWQAVDAGERQALTRASTEGGRISALSS